MSDIPQLEDVLQQKQNPKAIFCRFFLINVPFPDAWVFIWRSIQLIRSTATTAAPIL